MSNRQLMILLIMLLLIFSVLPPNLSATIAGKINEIFSADVSFSADVVFKMIMLGAIGKMKKIPHVNIFSKVFSFFLKLIIRVWQSIITLLRYRMKKAKIS